MTLEKTKLRWHWCNVFANSGTIFWILETVYFLLKYGWHWEANTYYEKVCDNIVIGLWSVSIIFFFLVVSDIINYLFSIDNIKINKPLK